MKIRLSRPVKIVIEVLLLALLIGLFVIVLDYDMVRMSFRLITVQVVLSVLGFQLALLAVQTFQWSLVLREAGIFRGLWRTFWSRMSGFSLTYLTPSIYFGGEPVRASLYKDDSMSYEKIYATIALDKYIELATKLPCIIVGFSFLVLFVHVSTALIFVSGAIILVFLGLFIFLIVKLFSSTTFIVSFFRRLLRPVARINPRLAVRVLRSMREFARHVHEVMGRRRIFYLAMCAGIIVAVIEVLQTYYILSVLDRASLPNSFVIFSTVVIQGLIGLLPGNLGGMEGTHLAIFNILRIGSTYSLIYTIILRIGQMTMALCGILNIVGWRIVKACRRGADRIRTDA